MNTLWNNRKLSEMGQDFWGVELFTVFEQYFLKILSKLVNYVLPPKFFIEDLFLVRRVAQFHCSLSSVQFIQAAYDRIDRGIVGRNVVTHGDLRAFRMSEKFSGELDAEPEIADQNR